MTLRTSRAAYFIGVVLVGLAYLLLSHSRSLRSSYVLGAKNSLTMAYEESLRTGTIPSQLDGRRFHAHTNIVRIGDTDYHCAIILGHDVFGEQGTLAITTNRLFVWFDVLKGPKVLGPGYR